PSFGLEICLKKSYILSAHSLSGCAMMFVQEGVCCWLSHDQNAQLAQKWVLKLPLLLHLPHFVQFRRFAPSESPQKAVIPPATTAIFAIFTTDITKWHFCHCRHRRHF